MPRGRARVYIVSRVQIIVSRVLIAPTICGVGAVDALADAAAPVRGLSSIHVPDNAKDTRAWMSALEEPAITVKRPASAFQDLVTASKNARQRMSKVVAIVRFSPGSSRALTNRFSSLLGRGKGAVWLGRGASYGDFGVADGALVGMPSQTR